LVFNKIVVESGTGHKYKSVLRNCGISYLGHLIAKRLPLYHPTVGSIAIYECMDGEAKVGEIFIYKDYWFPMYRTFFVSYINGLMDEKKEERRNTFNEVYHKLYVGLDAKTRTVLDSLLKKLEYISSFKENNENLHTSESDIDRLTLALHDILHTNPDKIRLIDEFKKSYLKMFIDDDLKLIHDAMGDGSGPGDINAIFSDNELILESNLKNEVNVWFNDLRSTKKIRTLSVGKYTFERFKDLLLERYIPSK